MVAYHYLQAFELGAAAGLDTASFARAAQVALAEAGHRAAGLNAYETAARHYRAALDLLSERDPRRARLLLRLGRARFLVGDTDPSVLERAVEELLAAGDVEGAAQAERTLTEQVWLAGERDPAFEHLDRAGLG